MKNTLYSSGQTVNLSATDTYTLKDNEVMINDVIVRKADIEIELGQTGNITQDQVKVGIRLRKSRKTISAFLTEYFNWYIDGTQQTSLADCVNNINTAINE